MNPRRFSLCLLLIGLLLPRTMAAADNEADRVVVLYNTAAEGARELAFYYAEKRQIPVQQILALHCSVEETITREAFDLTIAGPFRRAMLAGGFWTTSGTGPKEKVVKSKIRYVAVIRGVPLRIARAELPEWEGTPPQPPQVWRQNAASVDSELAALGTAEHTILRGVMPNPLHGRSGSVGQPLPELLLVTRLDGPTDGVVRRMIDQTLAAEKTGLLGYAFIDARGIQESNYKKGDDWLRHAARLLRNWGMPVVVDEREPLFPATYPYRDVAVYLGWYTRNATPPFKPAGRGKAGFRFAPGAIAVHIHSFSASTLRSQRKEWVGPLVASGACATLGNVYEPFLSLTVHLDIFIARLLEGDNFAEAGYAALPGLSWMNVLVGDPLYRPFLQSQRFSRIDESPWSLTRFATRAWLGGAWADAETALGRAETPEALGMAIESLGLTALAAGEFDSATGFFTRAQETFENESDRLRITLHEIELLRRRERKQEALGLIRERVKALDDPEGSAAALLREMERRINPPPPSPTPAASSR